MPTNLKNLLSRSRSRNELKLRSSSGGATGEDVDVPCCDLNESISSSNGESNNENGTFCLGGGANESVCHHHHHSTTPSPRILRREPSCKSLFSTMVSGAVEDVVLDTRVPSIPNSKSNCCEMRKCETVLALSSFATTTCPGNSSSSSSTTSTSNTTTTTSTTTTNTTTNRVRDMKDKILSTSSSTLNNLIHSSSRTTNKLFSAWKLSSSSSSTTNSNNNINGSKIKSTNKTRSQLSISENNEDESNSIFVSTIGPLTPLNRLRRNVSFTKAQSYCLLGSKYNSVTSLNYYTENHEEILCRLCLTNVNLEETIDFQACSCRYCKDCIEAYVNFEIQEGAYDIACPDSTCEKQGVLTLVEIERLVSTQMMGKHTKFRLYREVEKDAQLMWCPTPGCETVCQIHEGEKITNGGNGGMSGNGSLSTTLSIKCSTCQKSFCAECKLSFHPDTSCESFRRKLTREGKLSVDEDLCTIESIKKCPFCHVLIEKDSGCAQMMCKRCNHVFCWYCLASLDDDFLLRHYDKGPCKNKLGHSRASVVWHRAQVIGIFAGFGVLVLLASPLLILVAPCLLCCRCGYCANRMPDEFPVSV